MNSWDERPVEERTLLNPSFCGAVLWHASSGYESVAGTPLPFELAFLVLPIVLHRETRELLPKMVTSSLAVWVEENPLTRSSLPAHARALVGFTKEALLFSGAYGLLDLSDGDVAANDDWRKKVSGELKTSSDEVRYCAKRAEFVGKWFAAAGTPGTVMALLGVKP